MKPLSVTTPMKAIDQFCLDFPFIMLQKVPLVGFTFESLNKTIACYHWNESYWSEASCVTIYYAAQGGSVDKTLVCENTNESINFMLCFHVMMFAFQVFLQNFISHNQKITLNYPLEHQPYAFSRLSSFHHGLWAPWDAELLTPPIRDQTKTRRQKKISKIFYIASAIKLTNNF